jgi:uncharacterized damage-inducible protein DinB
MLNREALRELCDYTDFTWAAYANAVRALPPGAFTQPVEGSGWPSLHLALFHIAAAWDGWICARAGVPLTTSQPADVTSWEQLEAIRGALRPPLRRIIEETPDDALHAPTQTMSPGTPAERSESIAGVAAHILLHERGHHGDVTTLLHALGGQPPNVDYLVYAFFRSRRPQRG